MNPSRRGLVGGAGLIGLAASVPAAAAGGPAEAARLQAMLERYFGFGVKASGGAGDEACGAWLERELSRAGFACRRQGFEVPYFEARTASLASGGAQAPVIPQAVVAPTGPGGVTGPLRPAAARDLAGAIALVDLPYKRWVTSIDPQVAGPVADALKRGAAGVVVVTNGPSGEAIALNVSTKRPPHPKPVAVLAPKDAAPFLAAAAEARAATLTLDGQGGRRQAFNLIGRLDRKAAKTVVISTPRSGWFACAAERGSGLAAWLRLAQRLATSTPTVNLEFLATSGHEYEYIGGEHYLAEAAPKPEATHLWVHIGASAAARDWHELGRALLPLPSADSARVLTATADILASTRAAFAGISGLEATYLADKVMAGGELTNVLNAGYRRAIGLYGIHRYFHTAADDMRCTSGDLVAPVAAAFERAIRAALTSGAH